MPAALVLYQWRVNAIEVAAPGDCRSYRDRVPRLHAGRLGLRCHREIANRTGKTRRRVGRQWFHFELHRFTLHLDFTPLGETAKRIGEEGIGKRIVEIEQIEGRTGARSTGAPRD